MNTNNIVILIKDTKDVLAASNNTSQFVLRSSFGVYFYQVYRRTLFEKFTHKKKLISNKKDTMYTVHACAVQHLRNIIIPSRFTPLNLSTLLLIFEN